MKTKNLILALVAIVFAVGSAFTVKTPPNNVRIWKKQTISSSFVCSTVPLECANQATGALCTVNIITTLSPVTGETVAAYSDTACEVRLKHIEGQAFAGQYTGGEQPPYDVANLANGN